LLNYFEKISASDNQYLKTNPKSSERIVGQARKNEYVIIGDSLTSDIAFANRNNIKSIWYNRLGKENNTEFIPTIEIRDLREIFQYL
jgi:FMN phosphatase YigB (HAD superfamily)